MYAIYDTEIGKLKITYEQGYIIGISKVDKIQSLGIKSKISEKAYMELKEYFAGKRKTFDIPIKLIGTEFQKKVWKELLKIPYGKTVSYKDIAISIDNPKACRAIGMANHNNPILIIVPCHRVVNENGNLGGYALGLDIKRKLLEIEKKQLKLTEM